MLDIKMEKMQLNEGESSNPRPTPGISPEKLLAGLEIIANDRSSSPVESEDDIFLPPTPTTPPSADPWTVRNIDVVCSQLHFSLYIINAKKRSEMFQRNFGQSAAYRLH